MTTRFRSRTVARLRLTAVALALVSTFAAVAPACVSRFQRSARADPDYRPPTLSPAFGPAPPLVLFDEAHRNVGRADGTFRPFVRLLEADGLSVAQLEEPLSAEALAEARVLVVVNAKGPRGHDPESAFTPAELDAVERWVGAGGGLLLVADHTPFGAAMESLSRRFGVTMLDGEVQDAEHADLSSGDPAQLVFDRTHGLIGDHPILEGRGPDERVSKVVTFTGQSLAAPRDTAILLRLSATATDIPVLRIEMIERLFGWDRRTTFGDAIPTRGNCQAVALDRGAGRVVILGEAALLTAQVRDGERFGLRAPADTDNEQFALNAVRWLAGALPSGRGEPAADAAGSS